MKPWRQEDLRHQARDLGPTTGPRDAGRITCNSPTVLLLPTLCTQPPWPYPIRRARALVWCIRSRPAEVRPPTRHGLRDRDERPEVSHHVIPALTSACDRCRASKLRCQVSPSTDAETRCRNCARNDVQCQYSNPPPPQAQAEQRNDSDERLSRLEANVDKLLHMMERRPAPPPVPQPYVPSPQQMASQTTLGGLEALNHFADVAASADSVDWLPLDPVPTISPCMHASQTSVSPNTTCSDSRRPRTHESIDVAQARPIPKVVSGRRMAAFTDPEAYEAPFRPLAYAPDVFRNEEISAAHSESGDDAAHTPRRRGDPIDEDVLAEDQARALFDL